MICQDVLVISDRPGLAVHLEAKQWNYFSAQILFVFHTIHIVFSARANLRFQTCTSPRPPRNGGVECTTRSISVMKERVNLGTECKFTCEEGKEWINSAFARKSTFYFSMSECNGSDSKQVHSFQAMKVSSADADRPWTNFIRLND